MDRLQEKYGLFLKLGALFGPLQHLIEHPDQYNEQEKTQTIARYFNDYVQNQVDSGTEIFGPMNQSHPQCHMHHMALWAASWHETLV